MEVWRWAKMDVDELAQAVERLSQQVEQIRVHLGLEPPKPVPRDTGRPGKPNAILLHEVPAIVDSRASFTLNGPDIDVVGQLNKELVSDRDAVILVALVYRDQRTDRVHMWQAATHLPYMLKTRDETLAQFSAPLSSPERWKLLRALLESDKTATELGKATEMQTGQLYHHLRELITQHYVKQVGKKYTLTETGLGMFLSTAFLVGLLTEAAQKAPTDGATI